MQAHRLSRPPTRSSRTRIFHSTFRRRNGHTNAAWMNILRVVFLSAQRGMPVLRCNGNKILSGCLCREGAGGLARSAKALLHAPRMFSASFSNPAIFAGFSARFRQHVLPMRVLRARPIEFRYTAQYRKLGIAGADLKTVQEDYPRWMMKQHERR